MTTREVRQLRHAEKYRDDTLGKYDAVIPKLNSNAEEIDHVRIEAKDQQGITRYVYLKRKKVSVGSSNFIFVSKETLPTVPDDTSVSCNKASALTFSLVRLWTDERLRVDLLIMLAAIAVVLIDGGFAIGKVVAQPLVSSEGLAVVFTSGTLLLKGVLAVLALWKVLLDAK